MEVLVQVRFRPLQRIWNRPAGILLRVPAGFPLCASVFRDSRPGAPPDRRASSRRRRWGRASPPSTVRTIRGRRRRPPPALAHSSPGSMRAPAREATPRRATFVCARRTNWRMTAQADWRFRLFAGARDCCILSHAGVKTADKTWRRIGIPLCRQRADRNGTSRDRHGIRRHLHFLVNQELAVGTGNVRVPIARERASVRGTGHREFDRVK